ncbi:MAG: hypothetical protein ACMUIE_02430 [Thermoplasmatota archaeon]
MGGPVFMERIKVSSGSPYKDLVAGKDPEDPMRCPQCGCNHHATYKSVMNEAEGRAVISGDLKMRSLLVTICLNCGFERPLIFDLTREA